MKKLVQDVCQTKKMSIKNDIGHAIPSTNRYDGQRRTEVA